MFRKIKKLYFKIYHLLKLLGIFIIVVGTIPIVKADVTTCDEFLISESLSFDIFGNYTYFNLGNNNYSIPIPKGSVSGTPVYLKFFTTDFPFNPSTSNSNLYKIVALSRNSTTIPANGSGISYSTNYAYNSSTNVWSFNTRQAYNYDNKYFSLTFQSKTIDTSALVGTPLALSYNLSDIENCTLAQTEPEKPKGNEVYNNFITMYVEKIKYLAEGFTSNSYLLAMIGIIISWIVLELFLKVFHLKGGYKK